ncbi:MAG: alpha/beta hydrolase [Glutamicibacter sp.]|uniref:alpha/beta hydrolase n=1 Tax=Glutamicibacter sp. TaxID=1931995 RepID=UPI002FC5B694
MSAETLAAAPATASNRATYAQRVAFVSEMAGRLHSYGTTAQRLEAAVVALAQQLDNATLLTYEGHGHTAYGRSNECITKAVDEYLIDGKVPEAGTRC